MQSQERALVKIDSTCVCGGALEIGVPSEESIRKASSQPLADVNIAARCIVKNFVTIHEGVTLGEDAIVEDYCRIGANTRVGARSRLVHRAYICDDVVIGQECRIAGFVCDDSQIESNCTVMGTLVHDYNQPHRDWWDVTEPAPLVRHHSIVAMSSTVVGSVVIGPYAYVAAGALITRDVPSWHVAIGRNEYVHWNNWKGAPLRELFAHWHSYESGAGA
ncbi:MAG: acetyl/acyl transferase [Phycisphaeraceae bacterium]|nr:acetyl/acyl transferase [Phycisphaeraceae bacterium]